MRPPFTAFIAQIRSKRSVKIAVLTLTFFLFSGIAFASSLHGDYKGNPIIRVTSNGKELTVTDVPAVKLDDRTMVPVYLLRQLGLEVTWNEETQTVDVRQPKPPLTDAQIKEISRSVGNVIAYDGSTALRQGSGFVIEGGYFVTNYHVAEGATRLEVTLDGKQYSLTGNVFSDSVKDLYVVKIDVPTGLKVDTSEPVAGSHVYAIGYPHNTYKVTEGEVTRLVEFRGTNFVYSSAITDHGNSGGPLINPDGKVIAVNSGSDDQSGETVCMPISYVVDAVR